MPFIGCLESQIGGRPENQDYADFCDTAYGRLVVVCDGMGGGPGGATASSVAVKIIMQYVQDAQPNSLSKQQLLVNAINAANTELRELQANDRLLQGMGTTCICLLIDEQNATVAQVGDSRLYQLRFGQKRWRTWDHSAILDQVKSQFNGRTEGRDVDKAVEEARNSPNSNIITRAIGVADTVSVETHELAYEKDDRFALCTDGIWGAMTEKELIKSLNAKEIGGALVGTMCRVQEIGMENGNHHDNYTLALLQTTNNSKLKDKMTHKARFIIYLLSAICIISILSSVILGFKSCNSSSEQDNAAIVSMRDSLQAMRQENQALKNRNDSLSTVDLQKSQMLEICNRLVSILEEIQKWSEKNPAEKILSPEMDEKRKEAIQQLEGLETASESDYPEVKDVCSSIKDGLEKKLDSVTRSNHYKELLKKIKQIIDNLQ